MRRVRLVLAIAVSAILVATAAFVLAQHGGPGHHCRARCDEEYGRCGDHCVEKDAKDDKKQHKKQDWKKALKREAKNEKCWRKCEEKKARCHEKCRQEHH